MNPVVEAAEVVEQVKQYQVSNAYTDQQMADKIGYRRETYNQMKNGKMRASRTFIMGAKQLLSLVTNIIQKSLIYPQVQPPSTVRMWPVIYLLSSAARKSTAFAISSGTARRLSGICDSIPFALSA